MMHLEQENPQAGNPTSAASRAHCAHPPLQRWRDHSPLLENAGAELPCVR